MKESIYNHIIDNGENFILYNALSDEAAVITKELYNIYESRHRNPDDLKTAYPDFYDYLVKAGIIVAEDIDEINEALRLNDSKGLAQKKAFHLTVNPTLKCNMNCWYCYEDKRPTRMSEETLSRVCELIEDRMRPDKGFDWLILSFFGGEPLLAFHKEVKMILEFAKRICDREKKHLSVLFTTNGFLLDDGILDSLGPYLPKFQITLDGNEYVHNSVKRTKGHLGTYSRIVANIKNAISRGCYVTVRLNYTYKSLPYFVDVISDFENLSSADNALLSFNFQRIWQDCSDVPACEVTEAVHKMEHHFLDAGLTIIPSSSNSLQKCYADCEDSITINFDGRVFKCTARDFTESNSEGMLEEKGNISNHVISASKGIRKMTRQMSFITGFMTLLSSRNRIKEPEITRMWNC